MTVCDRSNLLFDALLKAAVREAYEKEIRSLPNDEELFEYRPSPVLDKRVGGIIRHGYNKIRLKRFTKGLGRAAACFCLLLVVSSIVLMSVSATRNAIFNAIIEWHEEYTQFQFEDASGENNDAPEQTFNRPTYLPEGYTEKSSDFHEISAQVVYENSAGDMIMLSEQTAGTGTTAIDNERHDYSEIEINGSKAYLFAARAEDDSNILLWEAHGIVYTLISVIDSGELIKIAESL